MMDEIIKQAALYAGLVLIGIGIGVVICTMKL